MPVDQGENLAAIWLAANWLKELSLLNFVLLMVLIVCIGALIWMRRRSLTSITQALSVIAGAMAIPVHGRSISYLSEELERARRYQRTLTVAVARVQNGTGRAGKSNGIGNRASAPGVFSSALVTYSVLACIVRRMLRANDAISYDLTLNGCVLLLVEIDRTRAIRCLERIQKLIHDRAELELSIGIAEYPADGYTLEELIKTAENSCSSQHAGTVATLASARSSNLAQVPVIAKSDHGH